MMKSHSKLAVGIDIGAKGCLAVVSKRNIQEVIPYDIIKWAEAIQKYRKYPFIVEKVGAKYGNSMQSVFSFGERSGEVKALLALYKVEIVWKSPQAWQKQILSQTTKLETPDLDIKNEIGNFVHAWFPKEDYMYMMKRKNRPDINKTDAIAIAYSYFL